MRLTVRYFLITGMACLVIVIAISIILGPSRVYNKLKYEYNYYFAEERYSLDSNDIIGKPITDDPLSKYQWNLRMVLDGLEYETLQKAPREVTVALIDRRVHMQHPDLIDKKRGGITLSTVVKI